MATRINEVYAGPVNPDNRDKRKIGRDIVWFDTTHTPPLMHVKINGVWHMDSSG